MNRAVLDTAAFLDSEHAKPTGGRRGDAQQLLERFLLCAYEDVGKAPRLLDGDDVGLILGQLLPARLGRRDPLAALAPKLLEAFFAFLDETAVVPQIYDIRLALDAALAEFARAVERGDTAHSRSPVQKTVVHHADKVGRNDPCPCGSGKKFKKCCARLGG